MFLNIDKEAVPRYYYLLVIVLHNGTYKDYCYTYSCKLSSHITITGRIVRQNYNIRTAEIMGIVK